MSKEYKEAFDNERNTNDQSTYEKMFNLTDTLKRTKRLFFFIYQVANWIFLNLLNCWEIFILTIC